MPWGLRKQLTACAKGVACWDTPHADAQDASCTRATVARSSAPQGGAAAVPLSASEQQQCAGGAAFCVPQLNAEADKALLQHTSLDSREGPSRSNVQSKVAKDEAISCTQDAECQPLPESSACDASALRPSCITLEDTGASHLSALPDATAGTGRHDTDARASAPAPARGNCASGPAGCGTGPADAIPSLPLPEDGLGGLSATDADGASACALGDVMGSMAAAAARPLPGEGGSPPGLGPCSQATTAGDGKAELSGLPAFDPLWQAAAVPLRQTFGTAAASCSTTTSARPSATTRHEGRRPGRASAAKGSLTSDLFGLQPPVARGPSVMDDPADPHAIDTSPPAVIGSASHLVALPEPRPPAAASSHYSEEGGEDVGPTAAGAISSTDSNVRRVAFARLTVFSSPLSLLADVSGLCRAASPDAPDGSIWRGTWCGRRIAIRLASVAPPGAGGGGGAPADWEHRPTGSTFHLDSGSGGLPSGLTNKSAELLPLYGSGQLRTSPAAGVMSGGALPSGAGGGGGAGLHAHSGTAGISSVIRGLGLGPANAAFHAGLTLEGGRRPNSLASFGLGGCAGPSLDVAVRASRIQHPNLAVVYDIRTAGIDARIWQELYPPPGAGGGGGTSLGRVGSPSVGVMGASSSSGVVTSLAAVQALRSVRGLAVGGSVIATLMEICELGHLGTVACRRPSPFQECDGSHEAMGWSVRVAQRSLLRTAREIASGLRALHAAGLAHGSLRPSNVLLAAARADRRGFVARLADAGSASLAATVVNKMSLRAPTLVMVAPEALSDTSALHTPAADVYAFGMLLYLMAAGEMPFQGQHLVPVLMAVASGTLAPDWPMGQHDHLAPLFARCIAHNPHHRPTADEILAEIIMHEDHLKDAKRHLTSQRLPLSGQLAPTPAAVTVQPSGLGSAEPSIGCVVAAAALPEPSLGPMIRSTSTPRFKVEGAGGALGAAAGAGAGARS